MQKNGETDRPGGANAPTSASIAIKVARRAPRPATRKGEVTKETILDVAKGLASQVGLAGLTIGRLADELDMSKSGLFAHFRSKEALQVEVLESASRDFIERVISPSLAKPRGVERVRALFDLGFEWAKASPGGCIFIAASAELDDQPGPARDRLVTLQREWLSAVTRAFQTAAEVGDLCADLDPKQLAYETYWISLGYHHASRLLGDPDAEERAHRAFEALIERVRPPRKGA